MDMLRLSEKSRNVRFGCFIGVCRDLVWWIRIEFFLDICVVVVVVICILYNGGSSFDVNMW